MQFHNSAAQNDSIPFVNMNDPRESTESTDHFSNLNYYCGCVTFHADKLIHDCCFNIQRRKYKILVFGFLSAMFIVSSALFAFIYKETTNSIAAVWFGILTTLGIFLTLFAGFIIGYFLITRCFECYKNRISEYHDYLMYLRHRSQDEYYSVY